jgi:signal transduction histidine kinase
MIVALLFFKNEQVAYQEMIEEKNRDLQSLNDTKEKLFSIISHDLRSPIGQLKSSLDLVSNEDLSPESFQKISAKLSSEVGRLHATLDNLLVWSISQLQGIKAAPVKVNLASILQQKMEIYDQMIAQKKLRIVLEDLDRNVWVDPNHLKVVLRNLISNAIKYSFENGYIQIRSSLKDQMVVIEVIDTGVGMSKEMQYNIFLLDHLISNTGTANEKGTGIGLKLCKEFIEKNSGKIWVESCEKKGSTFFISLPEAK